MNTSAPKKMPNDKIQKELDKIAGLMTRAQYQRAIDLCKKFLKKQPDNARCLNLYGVSLFKLDRLGDAEKVLLKAHKLAPDMGHISNSLAQILKNKDPGRALEFQRKAVNHSPIPEHLSNLATLEMNNGFPEDAIVHAKSAVLKNPKYIKGWETLCHLLNVTGRFNEALEYMDEMPTNSAKRLQLTVDSYVGLNDHDNTYKALQALIAHPGLTDSQIEFCFNIFNILGLSEKGKEFVRQYRPKEMGYQVWLDLRAENVTEQDVDKIIANYDQYKFGSVLKRRLAFALAGYFKKRNRKNWLHWLTVANNTVPGGYEYDEQEVLGYFDQAEKVDFSTLPVSKNQSDTPIFVLGMPRSGTTLTESILGAHSECFAAGEVLLLQNVLNGRKLSVRHQKVFSFLHTLGSLNQDGTTAKADLYLKRLRQYNSDSKHIVDKMPHNFVYTALIPKLFPNARIIHIQRNPIANILSIYEQDFTTFHSYGGKIEWLINYYKRYQRYMQNMQQYMPEGYLYELQYEDLVQDTENQVKRLLDFCGLPFEQACLEFNKQKRTVQTASREQVRQGIYTSSLRPWEGLEDELAPLLEAFPEAAKG